MLVVHRTVFIHENRISGNSAVFRLHAGQESSGGKGRGCSDRGSTVAIFIK